MSTDGYVDPLSMTDEQIAQLTRGETDWADDDEKTAEEGAPAGADADTEQQPEKADPKPEPKDEPKGEPEEKQKGEPDEPKGDVATPDGKNTIPYAVLQAARTSAQTERQARLAAEELVATEKGQRQVLEQQLRDMQAALDAAKAMPGKTQNDPATVIGPEELSALEESAPEIAKIFRTMTAKIVDLQGRVETATERAERLERERSIDREAEGQRRVEAAIANQPKIVYLREAQPEAFNRVAEIDHFLLQQPRWQKAAVEDRIAKSLQMYEAENGPINLPASANTAEKTAPKTAAAPAGAPHTLSDMPGGALPRTNEADGLLELPAAVLNQRFMDMDPEAIEKTLARMTL